MNEKILEIAIDPTRTALLLLHWQNELVKPEGKLYGPLSKLLHAAHTVEHTMAVLKASRKRKMLITYINVSHRPGYPEISKRPAPLAAGLIKTQAFLRGTWGTEIIDELTPLKDEIVIFNHSTSAFIYTELDLLLRNHGITDVVLTGLATNWVVESTARDAFNRGYSVYTLGDCCYGSSEEAHNYSLANILPMLGVVIDSKAYIRGLEKAR